MILPDKNIKLDYSLLNCGATIIKELNEPLSISLIWEKVRKNKEFTGYKKYVLTLDFLYMIKAIKIEDGLLMRCNNDSFDKMQ